jgi:DNA ligase (NAD+)
MKDYSGDILTKQVGTKCCNPHDISYINHSDLDIMTRKEFINFLNSSNLELLYKIKDVLDDNYYNSESIIDDYKYDLLLEFIKNNDNKYNNIIGHKIRDDDVEVKLPYWLGSLDKIKLYEPEKLDKWIDYINNLYGQNKKRFIITDKLDGVSCLYVKKGDKINLYTRGDGINGKDITYISEYINFLPDNNNEYICIRGELVINKKNFKNLQISSKRDEYNFMRNCVSGLIKSKTFKKELKYIDFIAYEIIKDDKQDKISDQLSILIDMDFRVVNHKIVNEINSFSPNSSLSIKTLQDILLDRKNNSLYDIDGIVIQVDQNYIRNKSGNPSYAIAFKIDTSIETNVIDVEWNITMSGILKPKVKFNPVNISGAVLNYATGYNANYIVKNCIGKDAIIEVTRSGEVIPKIVDIITPSPHGPKLPDIEYKWGNNNVDIYVINPGKELNSKKIQHFFETLNIKYINDSTINKLVSIGYDDIPKILAMNIKDFMKIDKCKEKLSEKIYNSIHNSLKNIDISLLMASSNCFGYGVGVKRLECINKTYPDLYLNYSNYNNDELLKLLVDIDGISNIMANKIIEGFEPFNIFYNSIKKYINIKDSNDDSHNEILRDKKIVISGFRNIIEDSIKNMGGILTNSVSKNTFLVIVKDKNSDDSTKIQKAKELGIKILDINEFTSFYISNSDKNSIKK